MKRKKNVSVNNLKCRKEKTWAKLSQERFIRKPPDRNLLFQKSSFMMQRKRVERTQTKLFANFFLFFLWFYHLIEEEGKKEIFRSFFCLWFYNNFLTSIDFFCANVLCCRRRIMCINHMNFFLLSLTSVYFYIDDMNLKSFISPLSNYHSNNS